LWVLAWICVWVVVLGNIKTYIMTHCFKFSDYAKIFFIQPNATSDPTERNTELPYLVKMFRLLGLYLKITTTEALRFLLKPLLSMHVCMYESKKQIPSVD
jgi:hypothetical protein